jgi:import receptor subunit TOM70
MFKFFRIATGRYKVAVEDCSKALRINPRHTWILYQRGLAYLHLGRYREALADFQQAAILNPDYTLLTRPYLEKCRSRLAG